MSDRRVPVSAIWSAALLLTIGSASCDGSTEPEPVDEVPEATPTPPPLGPPPPCPVGSACGIIAFVSERDGNSEIYTVRPDGTGLARLTHDPAKDESPSISPDGSRIAFVSDRSGNPEIHVMDVDGSNVVRRTLSRESREPAWSPHGDLIVYSSIASGNPGWPQLADLWSVGPEPVDGDPTVLFSGPEWGTWDGQPAWSPDGSRLLLSRDVWDSNGDGSRDLFIVRPDGTGLAAVTGGAGGLHPSWAPEGDWFVEVSSITTVAELWVVMAKADGPGKVPVVRAGWRGQLDGKARASWAPSGEWIAYTAGVRGHPTYISWIAVDQSASGVVVHDGHSPSWGR